MTAKVPGKVRIGILLTLCTALALTAVPVFADAPTNDISVTKTNNTVGNQIVAGGSITWTIKVTNNGGSGAPGIGLTDTVPAVYENIDASATNPDHCSVVGNLVTCDVNGIGNSGGTTDTIIITATLKGDTPLGSIPSNCATATFSHNSHTDNNPDNNTGCEGALTVVEAADMQVVKEQHDPLPANNPLNSGTNVTYRITATNNGASTATNVEVGDSITTGSATFVSATPVAPNTNGLDCSSFLAFGDFCTVASLTSGQSVAFDLVVTLPSDGSTTTITDTATTSSDTFDPDHTNNSFPATTTICQSVDLEITKACQTYCPPVVGVRDTSVCEPTDIVGPISANSDFTYLVTVTNNDGTNTAHNVILVEPLTGVTFIGVSPNPCTGATTIAADNCSLGDIAAGASVSFTIHVQATESGTITNTASVSADECERNSEDNSASCGVTVATNNMPAALEADRESSSTDMICETATPTSTSSDVNRVFEPGESVRIDPTWHNTLPNADPETTGTADTPTSPSGGTLTIDDCSADYGAIPANSDSDCNSATGDCYQMTVTEDVEGVRPAQHWDTHFTETLSSGEVKNWTLHIGDSFTDVPRSNFFYRFVETIYHNGITVGGGFHCTSAQFCPGQATRRDQITAFVARSLDNGTDGSVPVSGTGYDCSDVAHPANTNFLDTPPGSTFCRHANYLFVNKIVNGCSTNELCAGLPVTRGAMATIVARAHQWQIGNTVDPDGSVPDAATDGLVGTGEPRTYNCTSGPGPFSDVQQGNPFCKYVGDLWVRHVIDGYLDGTFRPLTTIRRDEIAKAMANAFVNVPLYGPLPGLGF
jgi:uncharacterized repeat protein (TIGR01451 family)